MNKVITILTLLMSSSVLAANVSKMDLSDRIFSVGIGSGYSGTSSAFQWEQRVPTINIDATFWATPYLLFKASVERSEFFQRQSLGEFNVDMIRLALETGMDPYQLITRGNSLRWVRPQIFLGLGSFLMNESLTSSSTNRVSQVFGYTVGGGFEVPIIENKIGIAAHSRFEFPRFGQSQSSNIQTEALDRTSGMIYHVLASLNVYW